MRSQHRISWHQLFAEDTSMAADFYGRLFGWELRALPLPEPPTASPDDGPLDRYRAQLLRTDRTPTEFLFLRKGQPVAGLSDWYSVGREARSPGWIPHVNSAELDAVAQRIEADSPHYPHAIHDDPHLGRVLAFRDMEGARINAMEPPAGHPSRGLAPEGPGCFHWVELNAVHNDDQVHLYRRIFGWEVLRTKSHGEPYSYFATAKGPTGLDVAGIWPRPSWAHGSSYWMPYVEVASVDASAATVDQLGGTTWVAPTDLGKDKRFALCRDRESAPFGLLELG